mgnify:CR=1 FL=1
MAATRLIALHINKGKTVAQCLADRTDYSENAAKTEDGKYISAYACDAKTCDEEFLLSKRQYEHITGRTQAHDVIAYQIRQSFKPGEITPEEANKVGYETAMRSPRENMPLLWQLMLIARTFITILFLIRLHWTAPENSAIFTYPVLRWQGSVISSAWNTGCRSLSESPTGSGRRERNTRRKSRSGMKSVRPLMQHWKESQKTSRN